MKRVQRDMPVYLDCQATTPLDPRVREAMMPFMYEHYGNPHSTDHAFGWDAAASVRQARAGVAEFIGADDDEIVFTSGATESCNLALRGAAKQSGKSGRNRIVTVATEHPAVLETVLDLGREGFETVVLPVNPNGIVDIDELAREVDERTLIVSVMAANNEIGVLQPLKPIAERCRAVGALFHTDAAQAAGRLPVDVDDWDVDLLSLSAHKVYGPKGVGALFVRTGVPLQPIAVGGGQERGLRSGTVAPPLVAGFGVACQLALDQLGRDRDRLTKLTARLLRRLQHICPGLRLFGHSKRRVPGNLCIGFPGVPAEQAIRCVGDRIAISSGSACASATSEPSPVLLALGLDRETAATGIRISLGRFTSEDDIDIAVGAFRSASFLTTREVANRATG